ncbi:alpha-tocopherol transfer protein-like isoform X1 [Leguminivora glycinivorella]|uniref:alpha-tocopherol transfer protein-like isoform X1 n=1 Tax=Leguminivora glycinivorella TaxID=1035111 RepID=UPI00200D1074|nr:alpha-tocopherol transfer protein-like isoform X1 [Leguminivora glycinivorella]XP_047999546.1 alpha-tocopherol transfer protein-like isoform X1 [Leguminivora glycinivorella]
METRRNQLITFHPDTLHAVRTACELETPGRMDEAIDLLQEWTLKQPHFVKKMYPRIYLEAILISTKGSVEIAKRRIDKMCTMRTFSPQLFDKTDAKKDLMELHDIIKTVNLPKLTEDHYRISLIKPTGKPMPLHYNHLDFFKFSIILAEHIKLYDYCQGFVIVMDHRDASIMDFATKTNLFELQNIISLLTEGYGIRMKGLHILSPSKFVDTLVAIFKQVFSAKLASRIHVHKKVETLYEYLPKTLLPKDLGGDERSISTLYDEWLQELSTEDHINYMRMMREACTDEKLRLKDHFDENIGLSGTFRALAFD